MERHKTSESYQKFLFQLWLIIFVICIGYVSGVAECMSGNKIKCFECNSHDDSRCEDPFNWTTIPNRKLCEGCCVKIVQGINTAEMKIRRGCTDDLEINLFIVDHVCMSEGGGKGRMCFCEENECNSSLKTAAPSMTTMNNFLLLSMLQYVWLPAILAIK